MMTILMKMMKQRPGLQKARPHLLQKRKRDDDDDDDDVDEEVDDWDKVEEEENWDPDFEEFDVPKSKAKKGPGEKRCRGGG